MEKHEYAELLHLRPEWMKLRIADFRAGNIAPQIDAAEAIVLHRRLQLLGGQIRML